MIVLVIAVFAMQAATLRDAMADLQAGRFEHAERVLTALVREQPESLEANYYLGIAKFRRGQAAEARPYLEKASRLAPERSAPWKALGSVDAALGQLEIAAVEFGKACLLNPKEDDACYFSGRSLYSLNRFEPAVPELEKALATAPPAKLWRIHRALAQALEALGRAADAERHFREAIRLNQAQAPPAEDPRIDYGIFLFRQGRTEESLRPLEEAVRAFPSSSRAHAELGRSLLQLDRLPQAAAELAKAIQLDAKNWTAHLLLGNAYLRMGRTEEGEKHVRLAHEGYGSSTVK